MNIGRRTIRFGNRGVFGGLLLSTLVACAPLNRSLGDEMGGAGGSANGSAGTGLGGSVDLAGSSGSTGIAGHVGIAGQTGSAGVSLRLSAIGAQPPLDNLLNDPIQIVRDIPIRKIGSQLT